MAFGDSAGGLLEGFRMANQDLQAKHQQLMNDAISQAQQQHAQQELDQQKTQEDNLNKYRTAQSYGQMLKSFQDYQGSGGTGSRFYGMWSPAAGDDKNMGAFLESIKNQGQSPEYIAAQKALQAQGDAAALKAQNEQDNAMRVLQEKYLEHQTTLNPQLDPNVAMRAAQATYPTSGGGQGGRQTSAPSQTQTPSSSVYPNDHQQNAADAVAKASPGGPALGTMTMPPQNSPAVPPQQVLPPVNGGAAPPASPSTGAGVPQSMVNPTSQITGDQGQAPPGQMQGRQGANGITPGLPAPAPPQPIQAINPNPYDGISAAFNLKQAAQAQKDEQERLATQIQAATLAKMNAEAPYLDNNARMDALKKIADVKALQTAADQANQLFPLKLKQTQADINSANSASFSQVLNARTRVAELDYKKVKDAADRADKVNGDMTAGEKTAAYTNATQLLKLQNDLSSKMNENRAAVAAARYYLDPNNIPIPDANSTDYAKVMSQKSDSSASITGTYNAITHQTEPAPLDAQYSMLKTSMGQVHQLMYQNQLILNKIGPQPTSDSGKPDKINTAPIPGAPSGTIGNGKSKLLMPIKPGAKGLAKVSAPTIDSVAAKLGIK